MPNTLVTAVGVPINLTGHITNVHLVPRWNAVVPWVNSWDALDAVLYVPDATTQAYYAIGAAARVDHVADGAGSFPFARDTGNHASIYTLTSPLPGPLWTPRDARFGLRPSMLFDLMGGGHGTFYAMLCPNSDWMNSATFFNPPTGYATPHWFAVLGDGIDCTLGSSASNAGPTTTPNSCTYWVSGAPGPLINTPFVAATDQTFLLIGYNSGVAATSFVETTTRLHDGSLVTQRITGTFANNHWCEAFVGWVDNHRYLSAWGIATGTPTTQQTDAVRGWAIPYLPVGGSGG
jgi:hypothetical protein